MKVRWSPISPAARVRDVSRMLAKVLPYGAYP